MNNEELTAVTLSERIGGFLFASAEPVSTSKLAKTFGVSIEDIEEALNEFIQALGKTGLTLTRNENDILLTTHPNVSEDIESFLSKEYTGELGGAALETLSIILYSSPVSKREIDFIRGVNSGYILRALLMRGLIEKIETKRRGTKCDISADL